MQTFKMKTMYTASPNFEIKLVSLISIGSFIPMLKHQKSNLLSFLLWMLMPIFTIHCYRVNSAPNNVPK